jgi:hypothetical protein
MKRDFIFGKKTTVIQEGFQVGKYFHSVNYWILLLLKGGSFLKFGMVSLRKLIIISCIPMIKKDNHILMFKLVIGKVIFHTPIFFNGSK